MERRHKAIFFLFLIFGVGYYLMVLMHEQVHVEIFRSYGLDSKVDIFNMNMTATTTAEGVCPTEECTLANNLNEVFGYQLESLYSAIFFIFIIYVSLRGKELFPED